MDNNLLRFHPPAWSLYKLLPKSWQEDLAVVIGSARPIPASGYPEGKVSAPYAGQVVNPWKGTDPMTYMTSLGSHVSNTLSSYLESLIRIRAWR